MSDLIDRRVAVDAIYDTFCYAYCDNCENEELRWEDDSPCEDCHRKYQSWRASRATIERAINSLPSAEPDVPDINVGDMISRQEAIDALKDVSEHYTDKGREWHPHVNFMVEAIQDLPSAQPETAKRIVGKSRDGMTLWYQCDMCNESVDAQDAFCRGCGRRLTDG